MIIGSTLYRPQDVMHWPSANLSPPNSPAANAISPMAIRTATSTVSNSK